jgi:hypothetical protein
MHTSHCLLSFVAIVSLLATGVVASGGVLSLMQKTFHYSGFGSEKKVRFATDGFHAFDKI